MATNENSEILEAVAKMTAFENLPDLYKEIGRKDEAKTLKKEWKGFV